MACKSSGLVSGMKGHSPQSIQTRKKPPISERLFQTSQGSKPGLSRIEFDDEVRFHDDRIRNIRKRRNAGEGRNHLVVIGFDVVRNVAFSERNGFKNGHQLLGLFANFDNVASLAAVRTDVDANAVDLDVAVVDELTGSKNR